MTRRELIDNTGGIRRYRVLDDAGRNVGTDAEGTPPVEPSRIAALEARVAALEAGKGLGPATPRP